MDHVQRVRDALRDLGARPATHLERKGDVLRHRQMREQRVVLEDEADIALVDRRVRLVPAIDDDPPLARIDQPADELEQRRLAGARRPQQGEELALGDAERTWLEGRDRAVALTQALDDELAGLRLGHGHVRGHRGQVRSQALKRSVTLARLALHQSSLAIAISFRFSGEVGSTLARSAGMV